MAQSLLQKQKEEGNLVSCSSSSSISPQSTVTNLVSSSSSFIKEKKPAAATATESDEKKKTGVSVDDDELPTQGQQQRYLRKDPLDDDNDDEDDIGLFPHDNPAISEGTPEYTCPEIIQRKEYGKPVDRWALGVMIFKMLAGRSPFNSYGIDNLFESIVHAEIEYPPYFSQHAISIIRGLMQKNPENRFGGDEPEMRGHSFFRSIIWEKLENRGVQPPYIPVVLNDADTSYFDSDLEDEEAALTPIPDPKLPIDQTEFSEFSYIV